MRWRQKLARSSFPRPLGPLLCSGGISCGLPSHGAFRFLAASSGGMRCRPYNYGEAVVFVAAPSHGAVRFFVASAGGMSAAPTTAQRHWIHKYTGSPITNVGDKLAGMTEGERVSPVRSPARRRHEVAPEAGAFFCPSPPVRNEAKPPTFLIGGQGEGNLDGLFRRCRSD